ncbi:MAG: hypothetical protein H7061_00230 [Bdellovibrionaceae bacterium]|nr:hypothetical protein [Bdellovibrio sp.]
MSERKLLKPIMVIVSGAFFGFYAVQFFLPQPQAHNRFLASATMAKLGSEQFAKSLFDLKIKNEFVGDNNDEVSVIKVTLEAYQPLPAGLNYSWSLPEGAELVDGVIAGQLPLLSPDQLQEFTIKVKGYAHDNKRHIIFNVKGDVNQNLVDQNVIVSSRPEDSFEYVVQQREKAIAKTQNKLGANKSKSAIDPKNVVF